MIRKKDKKYAKFLQDKDVVKEIVGMNHTMLRYMPEAARDQKGIVYDAVCAMNENEDEFYIVVVSVPEYFSGNQNYNYSIKMEELMV